MPLQTDLQKIKRIAAENEDENYRFRIFLKGQDGKKIDKIVHQLNDAITPQIDCTQCGNCCKSLMINITEDEATSLATHLQLSLPQIKEKYIEESDEGEMIINTIPCHFLTGTTCSIYQHRFTDCREFPHLHKPHFIHRLFSMLMYYEMCPIVFNVLEKLKEAVGYKTGRSK